VTHRFSLDQTKEALDLVDSAVGRTLRVVVAIETQTALGE